MFLRNPFNRITDKPQIRATLDAYMRYPEKQVAPFLCTVFSREHRPGGGIIYEGCRPYFASENGKGVRSYGLSNSDSNYTQTIAVLKLDQIEYIETLP